MLTRADLRDTIRGIIPLIPLNDQEDLIDNCIPILDITQEFGELRQLTMHEIILEAQKNKLKRRIDMCGGIAGPPMGEDRPSRYSRSPMLRDPYEDRKKKTGGMKKECPKCGQINPTNTECWKCGRYN